MSVTRPLHDRYTIVPQVFWNVPQPFWNMALDRSPDALNHSSNCSSFSSSLDHYHLREIDQLIGDAIAYVERWWDSCDDDPVLRPLIS